MKVYSSSKVETEGDSWRHLQIRLRPDSTSLAFKEIVLEPEVADEMQILAALVAVP